MSRWFRHYAGMVRDDKLVGVSIRAKQPIERVVWVWSAILESAAELNADGIFSFDAAEAARFLAVEIKEIRAILRQLEAAGHTYERQITRWNKRQFKSDRSAERVAKHRKVKAGDVTLQKRHGNSPETETETETEKNPYQEETWQLDTDAREAAPFKVIGGGK